jgi:methionyl-tRNA formyltransferase
VINARCGEIVKVTVIRGDETRHRYLVKQLRDNGFDVHDIVDQSAKSARKTIYDSQIQIRHFQQLKETEEQIFGQAGELSKHEFCADSFDIQSGDFADELIKSRPDYVVTFGCSIIPATLLHSMPGKFIGIHLGLSPFYRGSGSNFWPFYFEELSCVGYTIMTLDKGIDTGSILYQERANLISSDDVHSAGIKCSMQMADFMPKFMLSLPEKSVPLDPKVGRLMLRSHFSDEAIQRVKLAVREENLVGRYLQEKVKLDSLFPIKDFLFGKAND